MAAAMDFLVGTFTHSRIYTLRFTPPTESPTTNTPRPTGKLEILHASPATGTHSWLALSPRKTHLYTTVWEEPPTIAAYELITSGFGITVPRVVNTKPVHARSGCITASMTHVYSISGHSGEVFRIREADGGFGELVQELSFADMHEARDADAKSKDLPHGDFGGIRHGAHSAELAPDGKSFYVADIGRNCIWTFSVDRNAGARKPDTASAEHLVFGGKFAAPRSNDGPRHTFPHPGGRVLYSLQEHTSMVDVFTIAADGVTLEHVSGVKIIPADKDPEDFWADEVRVGSSSLAHEANGANGDSGHRGSRQPKYLYASTRGLKAETKGYVAVFALTSDGRIKDEKPLAMYETATSGGWANAVEPAPHTEVHGGVEYVALTDSEEGLVFVLAFDGNNLWEAARVKLGSEEAEVVGAATAVWL